MGAVPFVRQVPDETQTDPSGPAEQCAMKQVVSTLATDPHGHSRVPTNVRTGTGDQQRPDEVFIPSGRCCRCQGAT